MTVFRPVTRVDAPDGREWEIYAYKIQLRDRDEPEGLGDPPILYGAGATAWVVADAVLWLVLLVPRALLRLLDLGTAALRSVRSDAWTIEAVSWLPSETRFTWTTTSEHKGQVLAQVEGHLARGDLPLRLAHAVYRGESRSAR